MGQASEDTAEFTPVAAAEPRTLTEIIVPDPVPATTKSVELLICKCEDCTHWELGRTADGAQFILCKTCGLELPIKFEIDDSHHMLHWAQHER